MKNWLRNADEYSARVEAKTRRWWCYKDSPSAPPAPDYSAAATAQGQANIEAARATGRMNNPNIYTPYGSQTVSWGSPGGGRTFDAVQGPGGSWSTPVFTPGNEDNAASWSAPVWTPGASAPAGGGGDGYASDQPTITQTLSPESQAILNSRLKTQEQLQGLAQTGAGIAQNQLGTGFSFGGSPQTNLGQQGQIAGTPDLFGFGRASGPEGVGSAQRGVAGPNLQGQIDTSGNAAMPVNAGMTAQNAIMSRLSPQLEREQASIDNRLANQGITRGSEAYNTDQTLQGQRANDLKTQAALAGLNLDMSANAQGFGQSQARGNFANQAALSGFGADLSRANLNNAALGQDYAQQMGLSQARNAALAQNQGTALQQQQAQNAAQGQAFNQSLQGAQFGNTAQQQALAQALQLRSQPLNEINALMSSSQINNPQFQGYQGSNVAPAPVFNAAQNQAQFAQNLYAQQQGGANATTSGLFQLGGAAIGGMYGGPWGAAAGAQAGRAIGG